MLRQSQAQSSSPAPVPFRARGGPGRRSHRGRRVVPCPDVSPFSTVIVVRALVDGRNMSHSRRRTTAFVEGGHALTKVLSIALPSLVLSIGLVVLALTTDATTTSADPAVLSSVDGTCSFLDANGVLWRDPESRGHIVDTASEHGNLNVTCRGKLPADATLPGTAIRYDESSGFVCAGEPDARWDMTVTPSGKVHFTCHARQ